MSSLLLFMHVILMAFCSLFFLGLQIMRLPAPRAGRPHNFLLSYIRPLHRGCLIYEDKMREQTRHVRRRMMTSKYLPSGERRLLILSTD